MHHVQNVSVGSYQTGGLGTTRAFYFVIGTLFSSKQFSSMDAGTFIPCTKRRLNKHPAACATVIGKEAAPLNVHHESLQTSGLPFEPENERSALYF